MDENKREILEAVAQAEKRVRPFVDSLEGVSYEDIIDEFDNSDFGGVNTDAYIPPRLSELEDYNPPLLNEVQDSGSEATANYRLTDHGWKRVDEKPP